MLLVDNRVGSRELVVGFRALGLEVCETQLDYGDFAWAGIDPFDRKTPVMIGVERKVLSDLISSMRSNRLAVQARGMVETYKYRYLLVEGRMNVIDTKLCFQSWSSLDKALKGDKKERARALETDTRGNYKEVIFWRPAETGGWTKNELRAGEVYSYLNSLAVLAGMIPIRAESIVDTLTWVYWLYEWWQKDKHKSLGVDALGDVFVERERLTGGWGMGRAKPTITMRMAKELPGIGAEKARKVGKVFRSPREMVMASKEEWMKVEGVGKRLAERMVAYMEGKE